MVEFQLPKLTTRVRFPFLAPFFFIVTMLGVSGCATVEDATSPSTGPAAAGQPPVGFYHKVGKGETLWGIARTHQVDIGDIVKSNHIPNMARVEENQLIFIPGKPQPHVEAGGQPDPAKEEFAWPVKGKVLKYFGDRREGFVNPGVTIQTDEGQSILASREGKVVFADYLVGQSYTIILDHLDGFRSVYSQNAKLLVNLGDIVGKGARIAQAGQGASPAFLHFEIRKQGRADNPLFYLPKL